MKQRIAIFLFATLVLLFVAPPASAENSPESPSLYGTDALDILRKDLQTGSPEQKERALEAIMTLGAIRLLPEVMKAIEDTTLLPRHGDTGGGFVGHQAASVMWKIGQLIDGIDLKERGERAYSFWDDSGDGGEKLKAAGRLAEVRRNWEKWWKQRVKER